MLNGHALEVPSVLELLKVASGLEHALHDRRRRPAERLGDLAVGEAHQLAHQQCGALALGQLAQVRDQSLQTGAQLERVLCRAARWAKAVELEQGLGRAAPT